MVTVELDGLQDVGGCVEIMICGIPLISGSEGGREGGEVGRDFECCSGHSV